jgi:hypothetical protein
MNAVCDLWGVSQLVVMAWPVQWGKFTATTGVLVHDNSVGTWVSDDNLTVLNSAELDKRLGDEAVASKVTPEVRAWRRPAGGFIGDHMVHGGPRSFFYFDREMLAPWGIAAIGFLALGATRRRWTRR